MASNNDTLAAIILAAGKGTRMKSNRAKVLHEVFYRPMLHYVIDAVTPLQPQPIVTVIGHQRDLVRQAISGYRVTCVEQNEQLGTGHAVRCCEPALKEFSGTVLILCGDSPLLQTEHLAEMLQQHKKAGTALTIMTTRLEEPRNYGRIISDNAGNVTAIVEEKDATPQQRLITEINGGLYCVEKSFLFKALTRVTTNNSQQEMYLTDIVAIAVADGVRVGRYEHPEPSHVLGVNSRVELAQAHKQVRARRNLLLLAAGVTMHDPDTISIAASTAVDSDCIITERVTISGASSIGAGAVIEPGVIITDSIIGPGARIGANSVVRCSTIAPGEEVAPLSVRDGNGRGDV